MFDKLLNYLSKATSVQPQYTSEHCLVVTRAVGGCKVCADTCPHNAITIKRQVEIDDIDCTGCGLCVQACPSQALESSVSYQPGAPLKCSQVKGSAQSVQCLARLQPSDLLRLASKKGKVTLVRNECEGCKIGAAAVKEAVDALFGRAETLAHLRGLELETSVLVTEHYDTTDNPDPVSRRDLLRGGWRGAQRGAADVLAPLEVLNTAEEAEKGLPTELKKHYGLIEAAKTCARDARSLDAAPRRRRLHHVSGLHERLPDRSLSPRVGARAGGGRRAEARARTLQWLQRLRDLLSGQSHLLG